MTDAMTKTLGFHRDMCAIVFGEDSPATKFLDKKIAESPRGRNEPVIADESQCVNLYAQLHLGGTKDKP